MQKAIITSQSTIYELNDLLKNKWEVVSSCPMPSATCKDNSYTLPTCLVILEKDEATILSEQNKE